jgi:hypothetical protein
MVPNVDGICRMDSQDLAGPMFHPLVTTSSVFQHNRYCRGGDQAHSAIRVTTCTDSPRQSAPIHTFQQISPNLLLSHLCTLVAPPSMRDDLHSYLVPLLLQLFQILNVCLNRVFEEFILFIFGQVIKSLQD